MENLDVEKTEFQNDFSTIQVLFEKIKLFSNYSLIKEYMVDVNQLDELFD